MSESPTPTIPNGCLTSKIMRAITPGRYLLISDSTVEKSRVYRRLVNIRSSGKLVLATQQVQIILAPNGLLYFAYHLPEKKRFAIFHLYTDIRYTSNLKDFKKRTLAARKLVRIAGPTIQGVNYESDYAPLSSDELIEDLSLSSLSAPSTPGHHDPVDDQELF